VIDSLHTQLYRALVTHGGHTHGVHQPQDCPVCTAMRAYELRLAAAEAALKYKKP
jgi:hypothetical protein